MCSIREHSYTKQNTSSSLMEASASHFTVQNTEAGSQMRPSDRSPRALSQYMAGWHLEQFPRRQATEVSRSGEMMFTNTHTLHQIMDSQNCFKTDDAVLPYKLTQKHVSAS